MPQTSKKHLVAKPLRDPFDIKDSGGEVPPHLAEGHLADGSASPAWWQAHRKCTLGGRSQRHQGDGKDACLKNPLRPPQKLNGVVPRTCPRKVHLRGAHSHVQHAKDSMWFKVAGDRIRMILRAIGDKIFDKFPPDWRSGFRAGFQHRPFVAGRTTHEGGLSDRPPSPPAPFKAR